MVCFPDRWLDLRYLGLPSADGAGELLRGIVAQRGAKTVVALRSAQLITFTAIDVLTPTDPRALVPVLCVGLAQRPPARFELQHADARRARADERLRGGTPLAEVLDYLGSRLRRDRWLSRCSPARVATSRCRRAAATATGSTPPPRWG